MEDLYSKGNSPANHMQKKIMTNDRHEDPNDLTDNAPLPLHWINADGTIIWANRAQLEMLGYSREEYINRHVFLFYTDNEVMDDILDRLRREKVLVNYQARLRCKNGHIRHVLVNSNAYFKDGIFQHFRCYITDITEIKKEELRTKSLLARLQDSNTRLLWKTSALSQSKGIMKLINKT